jgi:hypothetical protein
MVNKKKDPSYLEIIKMMFGKRKNPDEENRKKLKELFGKKEAKKLIKKAWATPMPWNIYENKGVLLGVHMKKFHRFHFIFKYRFMVPLLYLARKILGKDLHKEIPNEWYNKNLLIFDRVWDAACIKWQKEFLNYGQTNCNLEEQLGGYQHTLLNTIKGLVIKSLLDDTAYKELFNIFCHLFALEMLKEYGGKTHRHLFYTSQDVFDVFYYNIGKKMVDGEQPGTPVKNKKRGKK